MSMAISPFLLLLLSVFRNSVADQPFDVRQHLSTVTRYGAVKETAGHAFLPSNVPDGCSPIHLNLLARHGTRSPTKERMRELDNLAAHLESLLNDVNEQNLSLKNVPSWLWGWTSPWKGKVKGGELTDNGEDELYYLGIRIRERFPDLFNEEYRPNVYTIKATQLRLLEANQGCLGHNSCNMNCPSFCWNHGIVLSMYKVPRASASAVAFGMGLFSGRGNLGLGHQRAFSVISENRASDILLRFFDCCTNYEDFRKIQEPAVDKLKGPIIDEITAALRKRYELNFTRQDTSSLWFLCKQEASLLDITDQACGFFSPSEVALLEWTDDLELFILKGYGNSLNYKMGVPLLKDVFDSMEKAIEAAEGNYAPGTYGKARLLFAHAETLVPFSCLLGLFLEQSEFQQIKREEPLQYHQRSPQERNFRGSIVAPFAGNNMLVLYSCPANSSSKYFVQVLHNEQPIPMPGCNNSDLCPFQAFKTGIVTPHLDHNYEDLCDVKSKNVKPKPAPSKLSQLFHWLFSQGMMMLSL